MKFNSETAKANGSKSKRGLSKNNKEFRQIFQNVIEQNEENITKWLQATADESPTKALELLLKISSFIIPKPRSIDLDVNTKICTCEDLSLLTDEELEEQLYQCDRILYPNNYKERSFERLNLKPTK